MGVKATGKGRRKIGAAKRKKRRLNRLKSAKKR